MLGTRTISRLIKHYSPSAKKTGAPPGTLVHIGRKRLDKVIIEVVNYNREAKNYKRVESVDELTKFYREDNQGDKITWVHVQGLHNVDAIRSIGEEFGLHSLVMEDILHTEQRPKLENYTNYLFITLPAYHYDESLEEWVYEQVSLVMGERFVLLFQESDYNYMEPVFERLKTDNSRIRERGSDYLAYAIIDVMVDYFFGIIDVIEHEMELLEDRILDTSSSDIREQIYELRRLILSLRRSLRPLREVVQKLTHVGTDLIHESTLMFLRDVSDHVIMNLDNLEHNREIVLNMMETYQASLSMKMNEVMKVLTMISTIFIPLSFIAGLYGMNFDHSVSPYNMPELTHPYGYPIAISAMVIVAIGMLIFFRRKDWI